jgi:ATP:ADP antiporter, AAA family
MARQCLRARRRRGSGRFRRRLPLCQGQLGPREHRQNENQEAHYTRAVGASANADARAAIVGATLASGGAVAQLVVAKAARDALFLSSYDVRLLPRMVAVAAVASLLSAIASSRAMARWSPSRVLPVALGLNAVVYFGTWGFLRHAPAMAAIALYVQVAIFGSALIAALWSVVNERFDPHSAKRYIGRIAMGGTLGGALGGLGAWKLGGLLGVAPMLGLLAALNLACIPFSVLASRRGRRPSAGRTAREKSRDATALLKDLPYLWQLGTLVALTSVTSALIDYVMSARVAAAVPSAPDLVAFFAIFHMSVGLASFALQAIATGPALARLGLAGTIALQPGAVALAAIGSLFVPGLASAVALRGSDSLLSSSLYRAAYELCYTPVPKAQKRPAKMLIDVGVDRLGTLLGSGVVMAALAVAASAERLLVAIALGVTFLSLLTAVRLHGGYVAALARSLKKGAVKLRPSDTFDATTKRTLAESTSLDRRAILEHVRRQRSLDRESLEPGSGRASDRPPRGDVELLTGAQEIGFGGAPLSFRFALGASAPPPAADHERADSARADLGSSDPERIRARLAAGPLPLALVPTVIELLGHDEISRDAVRALRRFGPRITGQLVDALLDRELDLVVRRRVPRVLEVTATERAVAGLTDGLFDGEFDVRHQSAWALQRLTEQENAPALDRRRVLRAVREELERGQRALERSNEPEARAEAQDSVQHAIVVLSLVLEREPLQLAYRALVSGDDNLRGTALEYFENVLPDDVRAQGLPVLRELAPRGRAKREANELRDELLRTRAG